VGNSGELQQQEVSTVARQRRLQSRNQSRNRAAPKGGRERGFSQGPVCNFRKLQGPLSKDYFNHCSRAQI
jgi:hypothetical protein